MFKSVGTFNECGLIMEATMNLDDKMRNLEHLELALEICCAEAMKNMPVVDKMELEWEIKPVLSIDGRSIRGRRKLRLVSFCDPFVVNDKSGEKTAIHQDRWRKQFFAILTKIMKEMRISSAVLTSRNSSEIITCK